MRNSKTILFIWLILFAGFHASESAASSITQPVFSVLVGDQTLSLPGATYKAVYSGNVASGNVDLYTGAAGKRTLVSSAAIFNPTAGTIVYFPEVKIGGSYFRIQSTASVAPIGQSQQWNQSFLPFVLEPGDSISVNTAALGLNISLKMVEYPSTYKVYSPRLTTLAASANTLYTVPANSSASILGTTSNGQAVNGGYCAVTNQTGGTGTYQVHVVPSAGSPGTTNQTDGLPINTAKGQQFECFQTMTAGDFVDVTSTIATAGQFAWVTVVETTN